MKILLIKPNKAPVPADIDGTLKSMQTAVDGYIQAVYPFEEPVALICNEEGKLLGLEANRLLRHSESGAVYDVIAGTSRMRRYSSWPGRLSLQDVRNRSSLLI